MKILLLLIAMSSFANTINLNANINGDIVASLIKPLWQTIPYRYQFNNKQNIVSEEISYSIEEGELQLSPTRTPLFKVELQKNQRLGLRWNLENANADLLVKIRFKFKQFGIQITHDEYFTVDLSTIKSAYSTIDIINGNQIKLKHINSINFKFESASIVARDGIGSTLRYILDNIFSKKEIDQLIKTAINSQLQSWINNSEVIKNAETEINKNIKANLHNKRKLPQLASTLSFTPKTITFSNSTLSLSVEPVFHNEYQVHDCASDIIAKGNIDISRSIFEKVLNNLTINQVIVNSTIQEPILCLGYKDGQDGENISLDFLNRKIDFKLWVRPTKKIDFSYSQDQINLILNLRSEVKTDQYPHLYLSHDHLKINALLSFKIHLTQDGLTVDFKNLNINSVKGQAYVKWSRFLPKVKLPLKLLTQRLEDELSESLSEQFSHFIFLKKELSINSDFKARLNSYTNENSFSVGFNIEPYL